MNSLIFDIETGPLPDQLLAIVQPEFKAPANYRDPEKIAAAIADKKAEWKETAALSAITGRVLAIGYENDEIDIKLGDEAEILNDFWRRWVASARFEPSLFVGFNILAFDLPFLIRRSWKLGVAIPLDVRTGRWWSDRFLDIRDLWQLGDRNAHGSLDQIAKHLFGTGKTGNGAQFAALLETNREEAIAYLTNDLVITRRIYNAIKP